MQFTAFRALQSNTRSISNRIKPTQFLATIDAMIVIIRIRHGYGAFPLDLLQCIVGSSSFFIGLSDHFCTKIRTLIEDSTMFSA